MGKFTNILLAGVVSLICAVVFYAILFSILFVFGSIVTLTHPFAWEYEFLMLLHVTSSASAIIAFLGMFYASAT